MIYVIGDSHVSVFSGIDRHNNDRHIQPEFGTCYTIKKGQLKQRINTFFQELDPFCAIKVGSWTAFQSPTKLHAIVQAIDEYEVTDNDWVFLCFGEIDIRHHIGFKADSKGSTFEQGIDDCLDRYKLTINALKSKINNLGIFGAIPSTPWLGTTEYPSYKDVDFRNKMTLIFNQKLKEICEELGVVFKEINTKMLNDQLKFNDDGYFMDGHHLGQKTAPIILKEFSDIIQILRRNKMNFNTILHTFGDSHASKEHGGWDNNKMNLPIPIRANWLGPKLMYSFARDKNILFSHNTVSEGDMVIFCFGEIDCRCQVGKYIPDWTENIDMLVENYFQAIKKNVDQYKDLTVMVYNVVPQIERSHPKNAWMIPYQTHSPHIGSDQERVEYTKYMNKKLFEFCETYGYIFVDVYDKYSNDDGYLIEELSDKNCHISNPVYVAEFMILNFWPELEKSYREV